MKKIYLSLCSIFVFSVLNGQKNITGAELKKGHSFAKKNNQVTVEKGEIIRNKTTIWSNDFSNAADWVIGNNAAGNGAVDNWVIGTTVPAGSFAIAGIASTTAANGFALFDSDLLCSADQSAWVGNATPIDLSATPAVLIEFESFYRKFSDQIFVQVSTDNSTWTDYEVNGGFAVNASSANPQMVSINISSAISGNPSNVYFRFLFLSDATNGGDGCDYAWMVDDVAIVVAQDYEVVLTEAMWGSDGTWGLIPFYTIPEAQIAPIEFSGVVSNNGALARNDIAFNVTSTSYTGMSAADTLIVGQTDTFDITVPFTPPTGVGTHNLDFFVTSSEIDTDVSNDSLPTQTIEVTQFEYGLDKGVVDPNENSWNSGAGYEIGNVFNIYTNVSLKSALVNVSSFTDPGTRLYVKLYEMDTTIQATVYLDYFLELFANQGRYVVTAADADQWVQIPFEIPQDLEAGKSYALVVGSDGGVGQNDFVCNTSGTSAPTNSCFFDWTDGKMYYTTPTPMVRMDFSTPKPFITSSDPDLMGCTGDVMTLTSSYATGNQWSLNGNPISGETNQTLTVSTAGSYTVSSGGLTSSPAVVAINSIPDVSYAQTFTDACTYHADITLVAGTPAGGTFSGPGVTGSIFDPSEGVGTYSITYSVTQNGCTGSASSSITVDPCAGVDENDLSSVSIYPNPSSTFFTVINASEFTSIELVDQVGRVLSTWKVNQEVMNLDVTKVAQGNYSLVFKGNDTVSVRKVQISK